VPTVNAAALPFNAGALTQVAVLLVPWKKNVTISVRVQPEMDAVNIRPGNSIDSISSVVKGTIGGGTGMTVADA